MIKKIIIILNLFIVLCVTENDNNSIKDSPYQKSNATFSTVYDQRQTGKYNINVNIKDLAIISVEPENLSANIGDTGSFYEDYYDYDLDDFTISPAVALLGSINDTRPSSRPTSEQTDITPNSSAHSTILSELTTNAGPIKKTTKSNKPNEIKKNQTNDDLISVTDNNNNLNQQQQQHQQQQEEQQQIPVQIIMDPIINKLPQKMRTQSRYRSKQHTINSRNTNSSPSGGGGYNLRPRNLNKLQRSEIKVNDNINECDNGEFKDRHGRCRSRRTALRKIMDLFTMLIPSDE